MHSSFCHWQDLLLCTSVAFHFTHTVEFITPPPTPVYTVISTCSLPNRRQNKIQKKIMPVPRSGSLFWKASIIHHLSPRNKKHGVCFRQPTLNFWDEIYPNCWICPSFCGYQVIKNIACICINQRQEITGKSRAVKTLPTVTTQIFFPSDYVRVGFPPSPQPG